MRVLVSGLVTALVVVVMAGPCGAAYASGCPEGQTPQVVPGHGSICVTVTGPGEPGSTTPGTTHQVGVAVCTANGRQIPCVTDFGVWFSSHQCYAQVMDPQPTPGSPPWQGHDAEEGQVWMCTTYDGPGTNGSWFFVDHGETPALVDPGELAVNAVDQLDLEVPQVHLAPGPPDQTYVGLSTWLWLSPEQWHALDLTVSAGSTSVTVLAEPRQVTWDLSEGTEVCRSPGEPWTSGSSATDRTDCDHVFKTTSVSAPGGVFSVLATLTYDVSWTCAGACLSSAGSLGPVESLPGTSDVRVGERQSVVTVGEAARR